MPKAAIIFLCVTLFLLVVLFDALIHMTPERVRLASPWQNKELPSLALPLFAHGQKENIPLKQKALINVFASWCLPCRWEHPLLMKLKKNKTLTIIGIAYKDKKEDAARWLSDEGNPYDIIFLDNEGLVSAHWGLVGVPENFILDDNGIVTLHHRGPLTQDIMRESLP